MIARYVKRFFKNYPSYAVLISLFALTIVGTLLLALPASRTEAVSFVDLFFTSTSLTTVTGLLTVPLDSFTPFGKLIILLLMQIGGLGLMTISLFFIYIFLDFGFYTQVLATEILSINSFKDTKRILYFIVKLTLISEGVGALFTFFAIKSHYSFFKAIFLSIFHAVSSFSNAGFSLFTEDILPASNQLLLFVTMILIAIGGIGFITWHEILSNFSTSHKYHKHISWHSKMVLRVYVITTIISSIIIWITEHKNSLSGLTPWQTVSNALFLGVSVKSTGFSTVATQHFNLASIFIFLLIMFIGSAPASTGSGIKTSVFSIYLAIVHAAVRGKSQVALQGRRLIPEQMYKALAIIGLSLFWIFFTTFCLLITETSWNFLDILLESFSAFSNSGISSGQTAWLSTFGKFFISFSMIFGRIGALAVILGVKRNNPHAILYPEEKILLG